jgi:4-hydroxybenzoate polyprenyltransferase
MVPSWLYERVLAPALVKGVNWPVNMPSSLAARQPSRRWLQHPWVRHLRLPFNMLLTPIYLWGVLLAGGGMMNVRFWLGYVSLHLFLYGGTTAFNSYYDKDGGPVGGMMHPPPVERSLLVFSLVFQALGLPLALLVDTSFVLAWLVLFGVFAAYSHPAIRLKANPAYALVAIALGQGGLGFALGWLVVRPEWRSLSEWSTLFGILTTSLVVTGLYIVTQSYQTQEDRARGDRTLPVLLGTKVALFLASGILGLGGALIITGLGLRFSWFWSAGLAVLFAGVGTWLMVWAHRFDETQVSHNFMTAMRIATTSSVGLSLLLLYHLR